MSKVWFITGSSRGLGRSLVEAVLKSGASVIATARNPNTLKDITDKFDSAKFLSVAVDVTKEEDIVAAIKAGLEKFGRIDNVVNNAGYANLSSIEDFDISDFKTQLDTNFMGVVNTTKAVLPILHQQRSGHIFQVSSMGGRVGSPGLSAYQSAKWAVGGFSTVLAQEVAPFGIKVTVLEPGGMRTDWAGPSMQVHSISEPYKETVGAFANMLQQLSGNEASLPEKVSRIILDLAEAKEAPLRLLIGPDAVEYCKKAGQDLAASDEKWRDVSLSSV